MPKVSIITINYNGLEDTIGCLESLKKITYPNYEVFVVDNASKNREGEKLKNKFGNYINLIQSDKNLGFSGGNNLAIREVIKEEKSKYICLLNNDTIVERDFLDYLVTTAEKNREICSVSPQILKYYDRNKIDSLGMSYYKSGLVFKINNNKLKNSILEDKLFTANGSCGLYSINSLKDICYDNQYFDEDFFMYSEELDLGFRLIHAGYYPSYNIKSIIYHKVGSSLGGDNSNFSRYYTVRNTFFVIYKNYPTYFLFKYFVSILIMQFAMFMLYIKRGKLRLFIRSYKDMFYMVSIMYKKRKYILKNSKVGNMGLLKYFEKSVFPIKYSYFIKEK